MDGVFNRKMIREMLNNLLIGIIFWKISADLGSVCHGCYRIYGSGWSAGGGFAVSEYGDVFPELFGFTTEYTDRDRQMDSTAYDLSLIHI